MPRKRRLIHLDPLGQLAVNPEEWERFMADAKAHNEAILARHAAEDAKAEADFRQQDRSFGV